MKHEYVVMKLMNGDTIICVLIMDNQDTFTIMYPVQMKSTRVNEEGKKDVQVGIPWLPYSDDNIIEIYKQDVILFKPLNDTTISYYKNLVDINEIEEPADIQIPDLSNYIFVRGNSTIH